MNTPYRHWPGHSSYRDRGLSGYGADQKSLPTQPELTGKLPVNTQDDFILKRFYNLSVEIKEHINISENGGQG